MANTLPVFPGPVVVDCKEYVPMIGWGVTDRIIETPTRKGFQPLVPPSSMQDFQIHYLTCMLCVHMHLLCLEF